PPSPCPATPASRVGSRVAAAETPGAVEGTSRDARFGPGRDPAAADAGPSPGQAWLRAEEPGLGTRGPGSRPVDVHSHSADNGCSPGTLSVRGRARRPGGWDWGPGGTAARRSRAARSSGPQPVTSAEGGLWLGGSSTPVWELWAASAEVQHGHGGRGPGSRRQLVAFLVKHAGPEGGPAP